MRLFCLADAGRLVPIRFKTAKTRLLLAYLLLHPEHSASRDTLATQFWPGSDRAARRRSLRDALSFLRSAFVDVGLPESLLETDRNRVGLAADAFQTDVAAFEVARARADRLPEEARTDLLEETVRLYGGPLLDGDTDIEGAPAWIEPARRRCLALLDDALGQLSILHAHRGELRLALDYARRAAQNAPDDPARAHRVTELTRQVRRQEQALPTRGDPGDLAEINHFVAPAARTMEEEDYERAHGHYRRLLAEATTPGHRREVAGKLLELGKSAHFRDKGQGSLTLAALLDALSLFQEVSDTYGITDTLLTLAIALALRGQRARAAGYVQDAAQRIPALTSPEMRADCYRRVAEIEIDLGEYGSARRFLERAEALDAQMGSDRGVAFCRWHAGRLASDTGDYDAALRLLDESQRRMAALPGEAQTRAAVLGDLGDLHLRLGQPERALPLYEDGLRVWEATNQTYWIAVFLARLARTALCQGRLADAARLADRSLPLFAESNGPDNRSLALLVQASLARTSADLDAAIALLEECVALRRRRAVPGPLAEALETWAALAHEAGRTEEARQLLAEADGLRRAAGAPTPPCDRATVDALRRTLNP